MNTLVLQQFIQFIALVVTFYIMIRSYRLQKKEIVEQNKKMIQLLDEIADSLRYLRR